MKLSSLWILIILILVSLPLLGQGFQIGTISGTVTDETGGVLPGVTVEVVSQERGFTRTATSGMEGRFLFPSLPLGRYSVTASLAGFQRAAVRDLAVEQDKTTDISLSLSLSAETAEITVSGEAPLVDPTNATVNTRLSIDEFEQAPVGRSYQSLLTLAPGVIDQPGNSSSGNPQVHGAQSSGNVYLFDGVDTTDPTTGTFGANLNFEAIQEVAVYTSGVSAEYGRATGATLNVITKSGTNEIDGSVKAIATNDAWDEQNRTTNPTNGNSFARTKNDTDNIRYSGTLGGPVWRDHLWFFGAYETFDQSTPPETTDVSNEEYIQNRNLTLDNYRLTAQITPSINVWAKYASDPFTGIIRDYWVPSPELFSLTSQDQGGDNQAIQGTALLSASWMLEGMYASSNSEIIVAPYSRSPLHNGAPHQSLEDGKYYNGATFDGFVDRPRTQALGAVSYFGRLGGQSHNIKGGIDWQELESSSFFAFPNEQLYIDESFDWTTRSFVPSLRLDFIGGPSTSTGEVTAVYLRDKFEVGERWYFEVGARYEQQSGSSDVGNTTLDSAVVAPRLSASYDLFGDGRTVAQATAGRFYQSVIQSFSDAFAEVPQQTNYDLFQWDGTDYQRIGSCCAGAGSTPADLGLDPVYVDELTFGFQQQIGATMAVGVRGIVREWGNLIDDVLTFDESGNVAIEYVNLAGTEREYTGLELSFEKRFSDQWSALANYTWSEVSGNHFGTLTSQNGDFLDAQCDLTTDPAIGVIPCAELNGSRLEGRPSWDIPHLVNLLAVYSRPVGRVNLAVGTNGIWSAGNSFSKARTATVLDPSGEDAGQTQTFLYEGQGSERLPDWWQLNLSTEVTLPLLSDVEIGVKAEAFNIFDNQDQFVTTNTTWCASAACSSSLNSFGLGTSRGSYQTPRGYRFSALVRF